MSLAVPLCVIMQQMCDESLKRNSHEVFKKSPGSHTVLIGLDS